jgi:hypothetical protein
LIEAINDLARQCSATALRVRVMEILLSRRDRALYQEYMDQINAPSGKLLPEETQKLLDNLRKAFVEDRA